MFESIEPAVELVSATVDFVGIAIILYGFSSGLVGYVQAVMSSGDAQARYDRFQGVRCRLGIHLILALEFMIVSDILYSVVSRTLEDLGYLGLVVVIRTVLAYFLERDMAEVSRRLAKRPA